MLTSKPFLIALGVLIALVAIYNISFFSSHRKLNPAASGSDTTLVGTAFSARSGPGTPSARGASLIQQGQPPKVPVLAPGHKLDAIAPSESLGGLMFSLPLDWSTNVGRNPFLTPEEIAGTRAKPVEIKPPVQFGPYVVTLISITGDSRWALIGNRVVREGDRIDDKIVIAITAEGVTLKKGEQQYLLRLRQSPIHLEVRSTN